MKKISTGALTVDRIAEQQRVYAQNHKYDFVIIGTGMSALAAGALLAKAGYKICMLEAHDIPGGYAHSFFMNDFYFCAQVHYIWGCGPGEPIHEFLKKLGLESEIRFVPYDPDGYDHMALPDGKRVKIPYGYKNAVKNIDSAYPGQKSNLEKFFGILEKLNRSLDFLPDGEMKWRQLFMNAVQLLPLVKYQHKTLQDLFNECQLSQEAQAVLNANTGDLMCPPEELSIFVYLGLLGGYNRGAYYPEKHFKYYIDRLAQFITEHKGCHIFYESEVTQINVSKQDSELIESVVCRDGKVFKAQNYLCNMDPQKASQIIGREKFPKKDLGPLSYKYSPSSLMVYLGVKGIDLRDYGFGNFNIWHLEQWDINKAWREMKNNCYDNPWLFMSTPTLHTSYNSVAPEGCQILEVGTAADYGHFRNLYENAPQEYRREKRQLADRLLKIVQEKYIPELDKHIALKVVGSPVSNETFCYAPFGNCYGSDLTPQNIGLGRLKAGTAWNNFYWCNASSGYPSICGTTQTGLRLYSQLTGDHFYKKAEKQNSTEEAIKYAVQQWKEFFHAPSATADKV